MRVTIAAFGLELDVTFGPADAPSPAPDGASLDGGTTSAYPMGFVAVHDQPDMVGLPPDRSNGWPDED